MLLSILLALLPVQDDVPKWIARLESESIEEREEATRRLQALGPAAVERLEKARESARDPEVKARLGAIIVAIGKAAELAKVFGPTKRVTIAARGRPLKEILAELVAPGVATVDSGLLDPEARLDFQVRDVTWWEALDRAARAAGARYEILDNGDGKVRISLVRGREPEGQVIYLEQFRIAAVESKRFDYRSPAGTSRMAMVVVEARHQPDMKPGGRKRGDVMRFDSVLDAKGQDARVSPPEWMRRTDVNPRRLGLQEVVWVRPDAPLPLTISGSTDISLPSETREIALDVSGDRSTARAGTATLQVTRYAATPSESRLSLKAEAKDLPDLGLRIVDDAVVLVDAKGGRHPGTMRFGREEEGQFTWEFEFPPGLGEARSVIVKWIAAFHRVELPFRLEGVRLP